MFAVQLCPCHRLSHSRVTIMSWLSSQSLLLSPLPLLLLQWHWSLSPDWLANRPNRPTGLSAGSNSNNSHLLANKMGENPRSSETFGQVIGLSCLWLWYHLLRFLYVESPFLLVPPSPLWAPDFLCAVVAKKVTAMCETNTEQNESLTWDHVTGNKRHYHVTGTKT